MSVLDLFVQDCHQTLIANASEGAQAAHKYLSKRNLSHKSIITHQIGFCPYGMELPKEIQFYGKNLDHVGEDDKGYEYFIRGRVIVPVFAEFGAVVGFATRKPTFQPGNTWWNLAKPFHKGNHLFLLDKVRKNIFAKNKVYLVEGYMDALLLYQEGLTNVCALMGTAMTPRKIGLLARYCNNICLCMDVDENESGQKATGKAILTLSEFGFCNSISVIDHLDIGEDPDQYVSRNGLQDFLDGERQLKDREIKKICRQVRSQNRK